MFYCRVYMTYRLRRASFTRHVPLQNIVNSAGPTEGNNRLPSPPHVLLSLFLFLFGRRVIDYTQKLPNSANKIDLHLYTKNSYWVRSSTNSRSQTYWVWGLGAHLFIDLRERDLSLPAALIRKRMKMFGLAYSWPSSRLRQLTQQLNQTKASQRH